MGNQPTSGKTAVLIGAGNLATHLGMALKSKGLNITQVFSRNQNNAERLSKLLGASPIIDLKQTEPIADFYIIAVKDDAISQVAKCMPVVEGTVVHTSGNTSLEVLKKFANHGVFYPLQTFTKLGPTPDFGQIPVCIEANSPLALEKISALASLISSNITEINSEQRRALHLAAVFACNFTNHLFSIAGALLEENNMKFELLYPLIEETVNKIKMASPSEAQTGPAARGDKKTMESHLELLKNHEAYRTIYQILSESIQKLP